jgi:hypothetical protein
VTGTCRDRCLEVEEPLAGTAPGVAAWFGVAWPKPLWHPDDAARSEGLPAELRALEVEQERAGRKLAIRLFQRAPQPPTGAVEVLALDPRSGRSARALEVPPSELAPLLRRFLDGGAVGAPLAAHTLLVCTDGRHDRCCAEYGRPVLAALRRAVERRGLPIELAESSHLGGHRFASTVLALPEGRLYGRLDAAQAGPLAHAVAEGRVLLEYDRGLLARDELGQVAEAAARSRYPDAEAVEVSPGGAEAGACALPVSLRRNGTTLRLSVRCRRRSFESPSGCDGAPASRERWVAESLEPR